MSTRKRLRTAILGTAALALGGMGGGSAALAADGGGGPAVTPAQLVGTLHRLNQMEIHAGTMAQRRGRTEAMKRYGSTLQHDHATADEHLKGYARAHDIDMDTAPPIGVSSQLDQARHELDNLQQLGGAAFDREFADLMVQDHQKAVEFVDRAATEVTDPRLKAMLGEIEPNLREHEQIAQNLLFEDNSTASSTAQSPRRTRR